MMITDIKYELDYCYNREQSLHGSMIATLQSGTFRATIRRNAYNFQSYGKVEVWLANGWELIQSLPIDEFDIQNFSYVSKDGDWEMTMAEDLYVLIDRGARFMEGVHGV
jgi:hypothetical protein